MLWKKIAKAILAPHIAIMIILIPIATAFLIYSLVFLSADSIIAIFSYVLAFYTLTVWCFKIPHLFKIIMAFNNNKLIKTWRNNSELRISISLYSTLIWNTAYALLQLGMSFQHRTFWFASLSGYYISLAVMRFFLLHYTRNNKPRENISGELLRYRACGIALLIMNLALSLMIFFMVYWNRTFHHHEITAIAMAAYTFAAFTIAIVNAVKYRKHNSPIYSASTAISLAAACVSVLTLESTMLTTFNDGTLNIFTQRIMLVTSGGAISVFIITMAIFMIVQSTKRIKLLNTSKE